MRIVATGTLLLRCAGVTLLFASLAYAQGTPDGHWEGAFTMNNQKVALSLDLTKNADSEWIGSMGLPSENATGLVVKDVVVKGNAVTFVAVELQMAKCNLTLTDGMLTGSFQTPRGAIPVEFKRTGEAKVELIPPSPAVSKQLEGDWEGSLKTPGGELPILVHFKNQADKTVLATIDTPASGASGLPLNDVKQTGQKVQFGIKVAHSRFEGTMNEQGTELAGQWSHEEAGFPLMLRKK